MSNPYKSNGVAGVSETNTTVNQPKNKNSNTDEKAQLDQNNKQKQVDAAIQAKIDASVKVKLEEIKNQEEQNKQSYSSNVQFLNSTTPVTQKIATPTPSNQPTQAPAKTSAKSPTTSPALSYVYIAGTCKYLHDTYGIGNFKPGYANYSKTRDRDSDGIACEM